VLVVCTGNICRSPMAEALLREYLGRHLDDPEVVEVSSAGTHARPGDPASSGMMSIATDWGVNLSDHWSRPLSPDLVAAQDLVLTMESGHRDRVALLAPGAGARTFLITEAAALLAVPVPRSGLQEAGSVPERLAALVRQLQQVRSRVAPDAQDVPDPYGGSQQGYLDCAWHLADLVTPIGEALVRALAPA
jgi:protein-tyrosine phosphatase